MTTAFMIALGVSWLSTFVLLILGISRTISVRRMLSRTQTWTVMEPVAIELEDEELKKPLLQRVVLPLVSQLGKRIRGSRRRTMQERYEQMLDLAGRPWGMTVVEFIGFRSLCTFSGIGLMLLLFVPVSLKAGVQAALLLIILPTAGMFGPLFWLRYLGNKRQAQMRRQIPDMVDLMILGLEVGIGFDSAMSEAISRFRGPLSQEFKRVLAEVVRGRSRAEALRDMAIRIKLEELSLMVASVHQAETLGASLSEALKALSAQIRKKRLRTLKESAAKLPVKLMFPLVLFIFPALLTVLMGPAALKAAEILFGATIK